MGQGLTCFEGCYHSSCYECTGVSYGLICVGCWMCAPPALEHLRGPGCVKIGCNQGLGSSLFCQSQYCFIPDWMRDYSIWKSIGERRGNIFDVDIIDKPVQPYGFVGNNQYR